MQSFAYGYIVNTDMSLGITLDENMHVLLIEGANAMQASVEVIMMQSSRARHHNIFFYETISQCNVL